MEMRGYLKDKQKFTAKIDLQKLSLVSKVRWQFSCFKYLLGLLTLWIDCLVLDLAYCALFILCCSSSWCFCWTNSVSICFCLQFASTIAFRLVAWSRLSLISVSYETNYIIVFKLFKTIIMFFLLTSRIIYGFTNC